VDDGALDRMTLDVADEGARRGPVDRQLDDRRIGGDVAEEAAEFTRVDGERLRSARVAVDDGGDATVAAQRAGDTLADAGAGSGGN
jgi:hypothetical protein